MDALANHLIDACGGTSAVAKLLKSTTSTVHSWRLNGLPESRFDHLRLASREAGLDVDFAAAAARFAEEPQLALSDDIGPDVHSFADTIRTSAAETGKGAKVSAAVCGGGLMAAQRLDNTPDKQALKAASGALVRAVGGVEAAETYCRANFRRLSEYGRPDNDCFMPVDVVADLQAVAHGTPDYPQVTRFLAKRDGFALVRLPDPDGVTTDNLLAALAAASREHSDIATGMLEALRDGEVSPAKAKKLHKEALESAEAAMRLAALLSQRSGEP